MEILGAGSFINLDNKEKIEQLVFTAQEIAETAIKNEGFTASEENNKTLALDIWQGLEYMCRDTEEVQIKNIFISNFLERMNDLSSLSKSTQNGAKTAANETETNNADSNDEYLGFVDTDENQKQEVTEPRMDLSETDLKEPAEESDAAEVENSEEDSEMKVQDEKSEEGLTISVRDEIKPKGVGNSEDNKSEQKDLNQTDSPDLTQLEKSENENTESKSIGSINLPEKEPYRFDECTVTATIQLFPVSGDSRKVVLSVRTHDFAPQISVHEFSGKATSEKLISALEDSFEKYKSDLPAKVMDKLRKEKEAGKKKKRKRSTQVISSETSQANALADPKATEDGANQSETTETAVSIQQSETNVQGSLFGS